jgi:3',5'-cyclic AMP phosphodiesterase CpdA
MGLAPSRAASTPKLWATSDVHVSHESNRAFVTGLSARPDDWLILGGDVCESADDLAWTLDELAPKFARMFWVPGNHELWSLRPGEPRGVAKYEQLVSVCRARGVVTPEDPYVLFPEDGRTSEAGAGGDARALYIAPLFLLYDYSFRPAEIAREDALRWARESGIRCADEQFLFSEPYATREAWCDARVRDAEARLEALGPEATFVIVNHYPLRMRDVILPRVPRFSLWCGTTRTEHWAVRFRARAVVYGHLHVRRRTAEGACVFHEVSLGYPPQWSGDADAQLRRIL